jgi:hypothetical protein
MFEKKVSRNIDAPDVDDLEVCKALNLPSHLAYTMDINPAAMVVTHARNVDAETRDGIKKGISPFKAKEDAIAFANMMQKKVEKKLKAQGKPIEFSKKA